MYTAYFGSRAFENVLLAVVVLLHGLFLSCLGAHPALSSFPYANEAANCSHYPSSKAAKRSFFLL